jgi:hypothetical protein
VAGGVHDVVRLFGTLVERLLGALIVSISLQVGIGASLLFWNQGNDILAARQSSQATPGIDFKRDIASMF